MVKESTVRFSIITFGLVLMLLILISKFSYNQKSVGVILSMVIIIFAFVIAGPMKKLFYETRQGTLDPSSFN